MYYSLHGMTLNYTTDDKFVCTLIYDSAYYDYNHDLAGNRHFSRLIITNNLG